MGKHGVLRVYVRGSRWWAKGPNGARVSLGLAAEVPRAEALRVAAERLGTGSLASGAPQVDEDLEVIAERWMGEQGQRYKLRSRLSVEGRIAQFVEWMAAHGARRASQVTSERLAAWTSALSASGRSGARTTGTVNRAIVVVRVCLRWAAARTPPLCAPTAAEKLRPLREVDRRPHPVIPSPEEWRRLVVALETAPVPETCRTEETQRRHRECARGAALLVAVAVSTGLRLDELRHLHPEDTAGERVEVRAREGWSPKSWSERTIPGTADVRELAREFVAWVRSAPRARNGKRLVIGDHWIAGHLDRAWTATGLPGEAPRMHDCRRTYATEMVRRGVTLDRVRALLGHRDVQTTERYLGRYRSDETEVAVDVGVADVLSAKTSAKVLPMKGKRR